jgi:alpha-L-rhamnosidase
MNRARGFGFLPVLCVLALTGAMVSSRADELSWPAITSQAKPWVWWWWPGSAVDTTNIARQLKLFQQAGLGGVQIIPIYGAKGSESNYIDFLSPEWMQMMEFTVTGAHPLGLGVDMALETGWCFGGPTITNNDANALVVEKSFDLSGGEKLDGTFSQETTQALMAFGSEGRTVDLTGKIDTAGHVDWAAPPGQWRVYAISQRFSGQSVKRAAPGGRGPMLNPLYPPAMRLYLQRFDQAFDTDTGPKPLAVFQDSYEYRCDWSPDFFEQFEKLRGYKLQSVLPALFGDAPKDEVARVKYDYRRTVSDILAEQTEPIWIDWAHQHAFQAIYQAHGTPGNWLDLYAEADIPETEMFRNHRNPLISKFASSAAHVAGRPLTGAETGTWLAEHFTETLAGLKYLADEMFLSGVNHIFYHGCCYSPEEAPWPGWVFYASTEMNPRNSIWHDVPALNEYIARCQSVLQSGKPDNDILLYWPVSDLWNTPGGMLSEMTVSQTAWFTNQPIGTTAEQLWNNGYSFDYVSDRQLQAAKVVDGKVRMPGGDYRVIVVPPCKYMPLETLKQLLTLVQNGAKMVMNRLPEDVPGLADLDNERAEFNALLRKIGEPVTTDHFAGKVPCGKGVIFRYNANPRDANVAPETMTSQGLSFERRSFDRGWNYFIANHGTTNFDGWITLGRPAKSAAILDPLTGAAGVAASRQSAANPMQVHLQLDAGGSVILRAFVNKTVQGPAWTYWQAQKPDTEPQTLTGNWNVKFIQGGPVLPVDYQTTKLASWTTFPDTNSQSFAGTARYRITFDAPATTGGSYFLDVGEVCQSARVRLNGKDYGTLITPPFLVVVDNLKPKGNRLEIEVTNVSANRIRDLDRRHVRWKYFNDINFVDINYRPFDASDWPLTDSGLLGPVTLTPVMAK